MTDQAEPGQRKGWTSDPAPADSDGWLALTDDELLFRVEQLQDGHAYDQALMKVVTSDRHFFVRQEAAKKIGNHHLLKEYSGDRHIGQILVRVMTRKEDISYLEKLLVESRHVEVKKAAEAQLRILAAQHGYRR